MLFGKRILFFLLGIGIFVFPDPALAEQRRVLISPKTTAVEVEGYGFYIRNWTLFQCGTTLFCVRGERKGWLFNIIPVRVLIEVVTKEEEGRGEIEEVVFPWWSFAVWWEAE